MNSNPVRKAFATMAVVLVAVCVFQTRSARSSSATTSQAAPKSVLLEKSEGERRVWREPPPGDFMLKVSPKNPASAKRTGFRWSAPRASASVAVR